MMNTFQSHPGRWEWASEDVCFSHSESFSRARAGTAGDILQWSVFLQGLRVSDEQKEQFNMRYFRRHQDSPVPCDIERMCHMHLTSPKLSVKDALQSTES